MVSDLRAGCVLGRRSRSSGRMTRLTPEEPELREDGMTHHGTAITQVHTVAIPTSDQDRALAFYTDVLGFEKKVDIPVGDAR